MPPLTQAQIEILKLHRDTCLDNGIAQSTFYHRKPEGTLTLNTSGGGNRNKRFTQPTQVRKGPAENPSAFVSFQVWATYHPQQLRPGARDAGDTTAWFGWMMRAQGQIPLVDENGTVITIQDEDWLQDPKGVLLRCENPVITPDGAAWVFECWSQR